MKKIIILIIIMWAISAFSQEDPSRETNMDSICLERGHVILDTEVYTVTRENVMPFVVDYPDSVIVYFYEDNIQRGTISKCVRCGKWVTVPQMDAPLQYVVWRRETPPDTIKVNSSGGLK